MGKKKNLEAENEVFNGVFRTPFALLFGGPVGVIINGIYTAFKANNEITREEEHKEFIASIGRDMPTPQQIREAQKQEEERIKKEKEDEISFLRNEFDEEEDPSFDEYFHFQYFTKDFIREKRHYRVGFDKSSGCFPHWWGGDYLPTKEFIETYKKDLADGNIGKKYKFYNNKIHVTFGYFSGKDFKCTGMFTQIEDSKEGD